MIEYVGMSKLKKYLNKVEMGNSKNKIKQTTSIYVTVYKYMYLSLKSKTK